MSEQILRGLEQRREQCKAGFKTCNVRAIKVHSHPGSSPLYRCQGRKVDLLRRQREEKRNRAALVDSIEMDSPVRLSALEEAKTVSSVSVIVMGVALTQHTGVRKRQSRYPSAVSAGAIQAPGA